MRMKSFVSTLLAVLFVGSCTNSIKVPNPQTPILETINYHGHPDCPNGPCTYGTSKPTTWMLTPNSYVNNFGVTVFNYRAVIVVSTPMFTDLSLTFSDAGGSVYPMEEVQRGYEGLWPRTYSIETTDDGSREKWFVHVATNECYNPVTFHIYDVGRQSGNPKSTPLDVTLELDSTTPCTSGGGTMWATSGTPTVSSPSTRPSGCPAGTQLFRICKKCQAQVGANATYSYYESCYTNWAQAQTIANLPAGGGCTISQVSGPHGCEQP